MDLKAELTKLDLNRDGSSVLLVRGESGVINELAKGLTDSPDSSVPNGTTIILIGNEVDFNLLSDVDIETKQKIFAAMNIKECKCDWAASERN